MQNYSKAKATGTVVVGVIVVLGIYFALAANSNDNSDLATSNEVVVTSTVDTSTETQSEPQEQVTPVEEESVEVEEQASENTNDYVNGTYSASKTYSVPQGHTEDISVTLTIKDDIITGFSVNTVATNQKSQQYQAGFDSNIEQSIDGTDLDEADVSRLGGASLTSNAFNDILDAIRNQAQS